MVRNRGGPSELIKWLAPTIAEFDRNEYNGHFIFVIVLLFTPALQLHFQKERRNRES